MESRKRDQERFLKCQKQLRTHKASMSKDIGVDALSLRFRDCQEKLAKHLTPHRVSMTLLEAYTLEVICQKKLAEVRKSIYNMKTTKKVYVPKKDTRKAVKRANGCVVKYLRM